MKRTEITLVIMMALSITSLASHGGPQKEACFELKPDPALESVSRSSLVDVNLGSDAVSFVQLFVKQLTGQEAPKRWAEKKARMLGTKEAPRRIDLALALAGEAGMRPVWKYTDPWKEQIPLYGGPDKKLDRDVGAVFMFFFSSPGRPNGGPGWANNHVPGMLAPVERYDPDWISEDNPHAGYYHPQNPAFWFNELRDANYAGLDFVILNVYGPDLSEGSMEAMQKGLLQLEKVDGENVIKLGMFDDTWTWGQPYFGEFWEQKPDCKNAEETAELLYKAKWKPFFEKVPRKHWYLFKGRPFIYFYNSNTLQNRGNFANVLKRMKELFLEDFGVEPFVAVDEAFNHSRGIKKVSDSSFDWYTFDNSSNLKTEKRSGVSLSHAMVRWDSTSRWNNFVERSAKEDDLIVKDDTILKKVLNKTRDSDILVIATWNDLGEGTGINRSYDYWWDGEWKKPNHFMELIRRSQSGEILD